MGAIYMIRCPWCDSENVEVRKEPFGSKTISTGLPKEFLEDTHGWFYYVCKDCLEYSCNTKDNIIQFVFTIFRGQIWLYISGRFGHDNNICEWLLLTDKEIVQFT